MMSVYDYADVLVQREHVFRQQRIRLVQTATQRSRRRRQTSPTSGPVTGIHVMEVGAVDKAPLITPTGETQGPSDHGTEEEAVGKAKQGPATTSPRGNATSGEMHVRFSRGLRRDYYCCSRGSNARQIDTKKREDAAKRHYLKAIQLKVWRALSSMAEIALLQKVKAERHHHYGVMHRVWIHLIHSVACSRAHKIEQVEKLALSLKKREAWRRWKHHHHGLVNASNIIRKERVTCLVSQHFSKWIEAWTIRSRQSAVVEHVATRSGQRARVSRFFHAWKAIFETSKQRTLLAEERLRMWQTVEDWLTPADLL